MDSCLTPFGLTEPQVTDRQQANFDWLDDGPAPDDVAARRQALRDDPQLLRAYLDEVRFDHHLAQSLAGGFSALLGQTMSGTQPSDRSDFAGAEQGRIWARVVAQAWADDSYKARLLADPAAVLREEGLQVPVGKTVRVVENSDASTYLVLPALPPESRVSAASELEHRLAAGCFWW